MADETKVATPKKLSAEVILENLKRAPINLAFKLTNPELHTLPKYSEFFAVIPKMDFTPEQRVLLDNLQEEMGWLNNSEQFYRDDKIRVYFILRLSEILYRGHKL